MTLDTPQQPDTPPGAYYVSVQRDDGQWRPLAGPFTNDHAKALATVEPARNRAQDLDPRAVWYAFGTVRIDATAGVNLPAGILNKELGLGELL